jgi:hypothetical protein
LLKITSPLRSDRILGTAEGAVARRSDRIIACPVKVMVMTADCGHAAEAPRTARTRKMTAILANA